MDFKKPWLSFHLPPSSDSTRLLWTGAAFDKDSGHFAWAFDVEDGHFVFTPVSSLHGFFCTNDDDTAQDRQKPFVLTDRGLEDEENGLIWNGETSSKALTYEQAGEYCKSLKGPRRKEWRLPQISELSQAMDFTHNPPEFGSDRSVPNPRERFWSQTPLADDKKFFVWTVDFNDGHIAAYHVELKAFVRCVRPY
jgi:hypothetical protein